MLGSTVKRPLQPVLVPLTTPRPRLLERHRSNYCSSCNCTISALAVQNGTKQATRVGRFPQSRGSKLKVTARGARSSKGRGESQRCEPLTKNGSQMTAGTSPSKTSKVCSKAGSKWSWMSSRRSGSAISSTLVSLLYSTNSVRRRQLWSLNV